MRFRTHVGTLAALVFGVTSLLAPAASASPAADSRSFLAEARGAGLTVTEAQELQERVNTRLAQSGGRQIAANKIQYNSGGYLLLNLPGEEYARELDEPVGTLGSCTYYYFCAFSKPDTAGEKRAESNCLVWITIPWVGTGSWINNQTDGTQAYFVDQKGRLLYTTPGAWSWSKYTNWTPVHFVDPCD